jgi:RNA polymerase sigma-70 factor (ECF subfamily)
MSEAQMKQDRELVKRACSGDTGSFETLYDRYEAPVFRYAFFLAGERFLAEELFQETWLRVARAFSRNKHPDDFRRWLFTIVTNLHRDELRKRRIRRFFLGGSRNEDRLRSPGNAVERECDIEMHGHIRKAEIRCAIDRIVQKLPSRQKAVFTLCVLEEWRISEVSDLLGIAEGTVKATLHRVMKKMRPALEEFRE